jgi:hypothetical protein
MAAESHSLIGPKYPDVVTDNLADIARHVVDYVEDSGSQSGCLALLTLLESATSTDGVIADLLPIVFCWAREGDAAVSSASINCVKTLVERSDGQRPYHFDALCDFVMADLPHHSELFQVLINPRLWEKS